jgi:rSAM/selenodomain-associated transferase 2
MAETAPAPLADAAGERIAAPLRVSIVIPALDEEAAIGATLDALAPLRLAGHELIVVDGGSRDRSVPIAIARADAVVHAARGRAAQMNAGAAIAAGDVLLFLHADTLLPPRAIDRVIEAVSAGAAWGRFDVAIAGRARMLPVVAWLMNLRSRLSGIATGDQAIFVRRDVFDAVGEFPDQPLMEDIELSRRLLARGMRPACLRERVLTSGRRWEQRGVWRTIFLMWRLRWRYWRGEAPERLARAYR